MIGWPGSIHGLQAIKYTATIFKAYVREIPQASFRKRGSKKPASTARATAGAMYLSCMRVRNKNGAMQRYAEMMARRREASAFHSHGEPAVFSGWRLEACPSCELDFQRAKV